MITNLGSRVVPSRRPMAWPDEGAGVMFSMLGSLTVTAALSLIIVVSPPGTDSPPGVPAVGTASATRPIHRI